MDKKLKGDYCTEIFGDKGLLDRSEITGSALVTQQ